MRRATALTAVFLSLGLWLEAVSNDRPAHAVVKGPFSVSIELDGAFENAGSYEARFKPDVYGGELTIASIAAHGSQVKKGDVLVKFDPAPWQKQVLASENDFRAAEAGLKAADEALSLGEKQDGLMLAGSRDQLLDAEKQLEYWKAMDGPQMLKWNELGLKNYEDNVKDQEEELNQLLAMYKSEELTTETADIVVNRAKRQLQNAQTYLEMRRQQSKKTPDWDHPQREQQIIRAVEQAKVGLAQAESNVANMKVQRETGLVRAKMESERQRESLSKLKSDGDKLTITSPVDGFVVYGQLAQGNWTTNDDLIRNLKAGEKAQANQVILTVVPKSSDVSVRVMIPEDKVLMAMDAKTATVTPVAMPQKRFKGTMREPSAVPSGGMYATVVEIEKPSVPIMPGMRCKVTIDVASLKDAVTVPVSAVGTENGKSVVYLLKDGNTTPQEVTLGLTNGTVWEIKSGLTGGESILQNASQK
jgi:HlyD family secretion protein